MNLIDPNDLAKAIAPIVEQSEQRIMSSFDETIQKALDRLHGIKIKTPLGEVEIDVPPRAIAANSTGN